MARIIVALGANLAEPTTAVHLGWRCVVQALGLQSDKLSSVYRSRAAEGAQGPDFANAVGVGQTALSPHGVLTALHDVEARFGRDRQREGHHGNRPLDLDLIDYDGQRHDDSKLMLPHPALARRDFVLIPLMEVAPTFIDVRTGRSARELTNELTEHHLLDKDETIGTNHG